MGYYTYYDLYIECKKEEEFTTICDYLKKVMKDGQLEPFHEPFFTKQQNGEYLVKEKPFLNENHIVYSFQAEERYRWDYVEEMLALSKQFPNNLFKIMGTGEESGDLWADYFLNGKTQKLYAKIPDPNLNDLL